MYVPGPNPNRERRYDQGYTAVGWNVAPDGVAGLDVDTGRPAALGGGPPLDGPGGRFFLTAPQERDEVLNLRVEAEVQLRREEVPKPA